MRLISGEDCDTRASFPLLKLLRPKPLETIVRVSHHLTFIALMFVYDYHPVAKTLFEIYFARSATGGTWGNGVPETILWSLIIQIASAIRQIHSVSLAARMIEPSKIIVTGKNRVRLNCCGIFDVIAFDGGKNLLQYQQEDLIHFGQLVISLGCGSLMAAHNLQKAMDIISRQYSPDLKNVLMYLLSKPSNFKNIDDVVNMMGPRILTEISAVHTQVCQITSLYHIDTTMC